MTEKTLLYELLGSSFLSSLSLERSLFCVLMEGHWFQSFLWRMLQGMYKRETINIRGCCYRRMLAVAICAIQTYLHLFMAKSGCMECSVMFLKCIFTSFHSIKLKVVFCRQLGGVCQKRPFLSQITTSFHLIFGERVL